MTRWKKDETEFPVNLTDDKSGSIICRVPKPILDLLGKPSRIKFIVLGKKIMIGVGDESQKRTIKK